MKTKEERRKKKKIIRYLLPTRKRNSLRENYLQTLMRGERTLSEVRRTEHTGGKN
jgi:hypothetical protein